MDDDFMAEYNRLRAIDIEAARVPERPGLVIVTLLPDPPYYGIGQPRSREAHRPITMAEIDRKIAHAAKRRRERANRRVSPAQRTTLRPYRYHEYSETPKGWTVREK